MYVPVYVWHDLARPGSQTLLYCCNYQSRCCGLLLLLVLGKKNALHVSHHAVMRAVKGKEESTDEGPRKKVSYSFSLHDCCVARAV